MARSAHMSPIVSKRSPSSLGDARELASSVQSVHSISVSGTLYASAYPSAPKTDRYRQCQDLQGSAPVRPLQNRLKRQEWKHSAAATQNLQLRPHMGLLCSFIVVRLFRRLSRSAIFCCDRSAPSNFASVPQLSV